jgi:UDP-N-acetylglucosamine--N-acetylmuramyl-(pentapeptide) pyrophosphoryl-undecaprenol N-acetylglucosamine transferase
MKKVFLAAGGTGGHINAALSIGNYLSEKEFEVRYYSGQRTLDYRLFKDKKVIHLKSLPLRYKNPLKILKSVVNNTLSLIRVLRDVINERPEFMIGAGGYVCGPVLLVGYLLGIRIYIVEQNSIMGLTNRILSKMATRVFYHFSKTKGIDSSAKNILIGNPTRDLCLKNEVESKDNEFNLLIFGGSLGSLEINNMLEKIINLKLSFKLNIVHQTGIGKDIAITNDHYIKLDYIDDMNKYYNWCDGVLCRAGASSVSELRIVSKPAYLVPYKYATDDHQTVNAQVFKEEASFDISIFKRNISLEENIENLIKFLDQAYKNKYNKISRKDFKNPCELIYKEVIKNVRN